MWIKIRFLCADISPDVGAGTLEVAEGASVAEVLAVCVKQYNIGIPLEQLMDSTFLIGKAHARLDRVLSEGDELSVIRPLGGG